MRDFNEDDRPTTRETRGTHVKADTLNVRTVTIGEAGNLAASPGSQAWAIAVRLQIQSLLKNNESSVRHLQTWLRGMEEHAGYRQLPDENGKMFSSYAEFCKAKPPWGLGYPPEVIDWIIRERVSAQELAFEVEDEILKEQRREKVKSSDNLEWFIKLVRAVPLDQPFKSIQMEESLGRPGRTVRRWKRRWKDLGWIESIKHGYYQITEIGQKVAKESLKDLDSEPSNDYFSLQRNNTTDDLVRRIAKDRPDVFEQMKAGEFETVWQAAVVAGIATTPRELNIPHEPKKIAEKLMEILDVDQLKELYQIIGEMLNYKEKF